MQKILLIFLITLKITQPLFGQINSSWRQEDINLFDSISQLDKSNPKEIEEFFLNRKDFRTKKQLGFGWTSLERSIGAGYISVYATFYYFKGTIKTYILEAWLPSEKKLIADYKSYYSKIFQIDLGDKYQYSFEIENILHPIAEFDSSKLFSNVSNDILEYMSPISGTIYGYRGGSSNTMLKNRQMFNKIKGHLTDEQLFTIMYSINPASRLTAIEYYQKNRSRYKMTQKKKQWIENIYNEFPKIETMRGCIVLHENSRALVKEFSKTRTD